MSARALNLDEFDTPPGAGIAATRQFVTFTCAGQNFGIDIMSMREIRNWSPVTPLPAQKPDVLGVIDIRGRVVPVHDLALRIAVQPGGCSGLRYQLFFDERSLDGDVVTDFNGVSVVVDRMSVPYLNGATIDFVDTIEKQGFTIDNPNATGTCACGDSFH